MTWTTDAELFTLLRQRLFSAVLGDVMDSLGLRQQFLPPRIQPLEPKMIVAGRVMPVVEYDCAHGGDQPFGLMLHALDDLKPHEVYLASGGTPRYALWGELMSARARKLGAAGAVLNGYSRDTPGILQLGFPVFSYGRYAQDQRSRGKVVDFRVPLEIEGVRVRPGDIVFGDLDGVVIIPREAEADVIHQALGKVEGENAVRDAIEQGMGCVEAFERFGVM